jgi:putative endonuclease
MQYYVYITTTRNNTALYTGVTNDLKKRMAQHKQKLTPGFTKQYHADKLVYCEVFDDIKTAIAREKQIKGGSRQKKIDLVCGRNRKREDLTNRL